MSLLLLFPDLGVPTIPNDTYLVVSSVGPDVLDLYVNGQKTFTWKNRQSISIGSFVYSIVNTTSDLTLDTTNHTVVADGTSNTVDITLPPSPDNGRAVVVICENSDNTVQILRNGKNITGVAEDVEIFEGEVIKLQYDSTSGSWW